MYFSHELQTCDWPRNVGCDGLAEAPAPANSANANRAQEPNSKSRYTQPPPPPPPVQPAAVVTSRGQPRQLHHSPQDIIKVNSVHSSNMFDAIVLPLCKVLK